MRTRCFSYMVFSTVLFVTAVVVFVLYKDIGVERRVLRIQDIYRASALIGKPDTQEEVGDVRILCWVTTMLKNLNAKTQYVKATWGKRCDVMLFIGSEADETFPVIKVNVPEGRAHLTSKTEAALKYVYENYRNKADWFLKADDDTFVLVDNLKYFLSNFNSSEGLYFGFTYSGHTPTGYNSGGAGYVLSREALRRFYTNGTDGKQCPITGGIEDIHIGKCMYKLGVKNVNTLDEKNRTRFHAYDPITHMDVSDPYLKTRSSYGEKTLLQEGFFLSGAQNISDHPFTFHYISGRNIRLMEFLIYHVRHKDQKGTVLE